MPDSCETANRFDPRRETDGNEDADKDGYTNIEEYLNGTNPREAETKNRKDSDSHPY